MWWTWLGILCTRDPPLVFLTTLEMVKDQASDQAKKIQKVILQHSNRFLCYKSIDWFCWEKLQETHISWENLAGFRFRMVQICPFLSNQLKKLSHYVPLTEHEYTHWHPTKKYTIDPMLILLPEDCTCSPKDQKRQCVKTKALIIRLLDYWHWYMVWYDIISYHMIWYNMIYIYIYT